jgi:triacylglycerol lipase
VGTVFRTQRAVAPPVVSDIFGFVHGCVNAGVTFAGAVTDLALTTTGVGRFYSPLQATLAGRRVGAALNGAIGDSLTGRYAALATPMRLRHDGVDIPTATLAEHYPRPSRHVIVMIHGLAENEEWWQGVDTEDRTDFGRCLTADVGASVLYVRYNSGRPIADNGRELADLLDDVVDDWPVPVERLSLVGHSMGGLVARSAVRHGVACDLAWADTLAEVVCLGTPHQGSDVERAAEFAGRTLGHFRQSAPLAELFTLRSAGIKNLRHGIPEEPGDPPGRQMFLAATIAQDPLSWQGRVFGDLLVTPASATDARQRADRHTFGGISHAALLRHPRVYTELRRWLSG